MSKVLLNQAHWYITSTCNLTCSQCYSFNNFAVKGHERWIDNESFVVKWSKLVDISGFGILGGEPMSNPDCDLWVKGLRTHFSNTSDFKIFTNGTYLHKWKKQIKEWIDLGVIISVHIHNLSQYDKVISDIYSIINKYNYTTNKNGKQYPEYYDDYDFIIFINNKPAFLVEKDNYFVKFGPTYDKGIYKFNNSNAEDVHKSCPSLLKDCPYFFKGKLYKCGPVVGGREFIKKYKTEQYVKDLLDSYRPISLDDDVKTEIEKLKNYIPQCSLCPFYNEDAELVNLMPMTTKKIK